MSDHAKKYYSAFVAMVTKLEKLQSPRTFPYLYILCFLLISNRNSMSFQCFFLFNICSISFWCVFNISSTTKMFLKKENRMTVLTNMIRLDICQYRILYVFLASIKEFFDKGLSTQSFITPVTLADKIHFVYDSCASKDSTNTTYHAVNHCSRNAGWLNPSERNLAIVLS